MGLQGRRRFLIGASSILAGSLAAQVQGRERMHMVGQMWNYHPRDPNRPNPVRRRYVGELKALGWTVGKNIAFRRLWSEGDFGRLPGMAKELVDEKVDVIWVSDTATAVEAVRATRTIPIVLLGACAYPVECGLIESFAHPGGNVTGVAWGQGVEVQSKLVQFAREILPSAKKLAWIAIPPDLVTVSGGEFQPRPYYEKIASRLAFELGYYECRSAEDFAPVFAALRTWGAQAVVVEPSPVSVEAGRHIAQLAVEAHIATFFNVLPNALAGGLLSYGPSFLNVLDLTVGYTDRILRGARPANLPVEMPNKLELVVNQKTAKALSVTIPNSVVLLADRVIG